LRGGEGRRHGRGWSGVTHGLLLGTGGSKPRVIWRSFCASRCAGHCRHDAWPVQNCQLLGGVAEIVLVALEPGTDALIEDAPGCRPAPRCARRRRPSAPTYGLGRDSGCRQEVVAQQALNSESRHGRAIALPTLGCRTSASMMRATEIRCTRYGKAAPSASLCEICAEVNEHWFSRTTCGQTDRRVDRDGD
jgi:hypothetical protein